MVGWAEATLVDSGKCSRICQFFHPCKSIITNIPLRFLSNHQKAYTCFCTVSIFSRLLSWYCLTKRYIIIDLVRAKNRLIMLQTTEKQGLR